MLHFNCNKLNSIEAFYIRFDHKIICFKLHFYKLLFVDILHFLKEYTFLNFYLKICLCIYLNIGCLFTNKGKAYPLGARTTV